jgi:hypothetical protein
MFDKIVQEMLTEIMFEEKAEKATLDLYGSADDVYGKEDYKQGFKDGAEFGYNKANEWHFVKDGDLPKENQLVMVYRVNPLGANIAITNWYDSYKYTKVIAWKEIVLPKECE